MALGDDSQWPRRRANWAGLVGSKVPGFSSSGTSSPVSQGTTTSGMPPMAEATTAVSVAIASRLMIPNGS